MEWFEHTRGDRLILAEVCWTTPARHTAGMVVLNNLMQWALMYDGIADDRVCSVPPP